LLEGVGDGLVKMVKWRLSVYGGMIYGLVDGMQLAIVFAVLLLGRNEFLCEEGEWMPGVLDVLQ
jgi:hypothetical protein